MLLFAITVTGITVNTLITPSIPEILEGLGAPQALSGVLIGAATLPGILLAPVIGVLADRYGRREVLIPCLIVFAVAGGLASLSPSIWWLAAARFAQGAGSAGLINLVVVIIGDNWEGDRRAQIIGWNSAVLTGSIALLPTFGGALTDLGSWRTPFLVYPFALLTAVGVWWLVPHGERSTQTLGDQVREALPLLRKLSTVVTIAAAVLTFALIFGVLLTVLPQYLAENYSLSPAWRGVVLGLPAVANGIVSVSLGWLRRYIPRRRMLVLAAAFFSAGLVAVFSSSPLLGIAAGLVIFGIGEGLMIPNLQDIATGAAPPRQRGTSVALFVSGARLGQTVGPLAAGAAFGAFGAGVVFLGGAAVAVALSVGLHVFLARHPREDAEARA